MSLYRSRMPLLAYPARPRHDDAEDGGFPWCGTGAFGVGLLELTSLGGIPSSKVFLGTNSIISDTRVPCLLTRASLSH